MTIRIGAPVWYRPGRNEGLNVLLGQPLAATVAAVHPDGRINIGGFDASGWPFHRSNVVLVQDGEAPPIDNAGITGYAQWPARAPSETLRLPAKKRGAA